jgi:F420-0:gamma-glutamyl ligase
MEIIKGEGRHQVILEATSIGNDLEVRIFNNSAHIGAVAIAEYDFKNKRASVSVITRLGHKEDAIAQKAAYLICKSSHKTVCVIAGIHLDNIKQTEIGALQQNATLAVEELSRSLT